MTLYYKTKDRKYDLSQLTSEERVLFDRLMEEYRSASSWPSFQQHTARPTLGLAKRINGDNWRDHPLYQIHLDLMGNVGVRSGKMEGELSDMIVEE